MYTYIQEGELIYEVRYEREKDRDREGERQNCGKDAFINCCEYGLEEKNASHGG